MQFPCFCKKVGWDAKYCCQGHVLAKNSVTETIIITTLVWRIIVLVACYPLSFPALNFRLPRMITLIQVVKFLRVDNKYEVSLEYYMMFICLYFLFLFSWSNIVAQFATFPYIAICRNHPRKVNKGVTEKILLVPVVTKHETSLMDVPLCSSTVASALSSWFVFIPHRSA